jgi:MFS family permease
LRAAIRLLRAEGDTRLFFAALAQSSIGTGAAYVALLLIAYARFRSSWAISLILLAEFLPVMVLGVIFGSAADRWSRRWCAVGADTIRALAFVGIALTNSFELTLALALIAGAGTAIFRPAALAGLPGLVGKEHAPAATALFSATTQLGWTVGPALAGVALLIASPETISLVNGITFAISAVALVAVPLDRGARTTALVQEPQSSLWRDGVDGWRTAARLVDIRIVILVSASAMFMGGVFNVAEPLFATKTLLAGQAGYAVLVAVYGVGFIVGSLAGSTGGDAPLMRRRYVQGLALTAVGSLFTALSPGLAFALFAFAIAGCGNGFFVVYERLLIQERVPQQSFGRTFGVADTLSSWGLAASFLTAGLLSAWASPRGLIGIVAAGETVLVLAAFVALRSKSELRSGLTSPSAGLVQERSAGRSSG